MGRVVIVAPPLSLFVADANSSKKRLNVEGYIHSEIRGPDSPLVATNHSLHVMVDDHNPVSVMYDPLTEEILLRNHRVKAQFSFKQEVEGTQYVRIYTSGLYSFWDYTELEEFASTLHGDLLYQRVPASDMWNVAVQQRDQMATNERLNRQRNHTIRCKVKDPEEVKTWMEENVREYAMDVFDSTYNKKDELTEVIIQVRNDSDAVMTKIRWYNVD